MAYIPIAFPPGIYHNGTETMRRFWSKCNRLGETECWNWTGAKTPKGYGTLSFHGRHDYAHRVAYRVHKGDIPAGMDVCHSCDNPSCVNPSHLWVGTRADNMADCKAKKRARGPNYRGSKIGTSKLKEHEVAAIKIALENGATLAELGRAYGVSYQAIGRIKCGANWRHVDVHRT